MLREESPGRLRKSLKRSLSKATGIPSHAGDHSIGYVSSHGRKDVPLQSTTQQVIADL